MINERVCIFSDSSTKQLTADVNAFIKWQEAIGNIIHDVKISTCDNTCEAMVIWQMVTKGNEEISIVSSNFGKNIYKVLFTLDNIENLTIVTNDQRIVKQLVDLDDIVIDCEVWNSTVNEDGGIEYKTMYRREIPNSPLKLPRQKGYC